MFDFLKKKSDPTPQPELEQQQAPSRKQMLGDSFEEQQKALSPMDQMRGKLTGKEALYQARLALPGRHKGVMKDAKDIPNRHIIMEQLAHRGAYKGIDAKTAAEWGYREMGAVDDPESGFRAVLYAPTEEALKGETPQSKVIRATHGGAPVPVIAFRGTANKKGVADDVNREGIGAYQFGSNKEKVAGLFAAAGGKALVTGHSLGGALAQHAAANFPGSTMEVVTFQSPGVDKSVAKKVAKHNEKAGPGKGIASTHYRAQGDIVHAAGEALTEGDAYTFRSVGLGNGMDHTQFPLARLAAARGGVLGSVGKGGEKSDRLVGIDKTHTSDEKGDVANKIAEWGRKALGGIVRDETMEKYVQFWEKIVALVKTQSFSLNYIGEIIEINPDLTPPQKAKMRMQCEQLYLQVAKGD